MKKILLVALIFVILILSLTGCNSVVGNMQVFDTTFQFDYAVICLPSGEVIRGEVESWKDYNDSDQLQVKLKNGKTYLTHAANVILTNDENQYWDGGEY